MLFVYHDWSDENYIPLLIWFLDMGLSDFPSSREFRYDEILRTLSIIDFWKNSFSYLLADMTAVLCELELTIEKVKVSTTPDGKVMDLFFITDTRFCSFVIYFSRSAKILFLSLTASFVFINIVTGAMLLRFHVIH